MSSLAICSFVEEPIARLSAVLSNYHYTDGEGMFILSLTNSCTEDPF